ncbi:hypothetical protein PsorP6_002946 [Peronosclerospora sorghi]|uniref:Uncharacterized protein n=1 Tax=Peronosclerospora sorghi TaxID=230839 RepID=A0ACC0VNZ0_9STRA|nr:hypothetical protein PsorP6_002946 [Peronosclerospora sorghi]
MLQDARLAAATMVVASDGKSRAQIQRQLKQKAQAIRSLTTTYASRAISRETLADNQYHLYFERDLIDRMITLLTTHCDPENGTRYELTDTGKDCIGFKTRHASRAPCTVIHLGDKHVPNALMFIDKYTQVGHILRPIVKTVDRIVSLCVSSTDIADYVTTTFDSVQQLQTRDPGGFFPGSVFHSAEFVARILLISLNLMDQISYL